MVCSWTTWGRKTVQEHCW